MGLQPVGEVREGIPPMEVKILFLAAEWGCTPHWYYGHCWKSSLSNNVQFFVTEYEFYPPMHAPPYLGKYILVKESVYQPELF